MPLDLSIVLQHETFKISAVSIFSLSVFFYLVSLLSALLKLDFSKMQPFFCCLIYLSCSSYYPILLTALGIKGHAFLLETLSEFSWCHTLWLFSSPTGFSINFIADLPSTTPLSPALGPLLSSLHSLPESSDPIPCSICHLCPSDTKMYVFSPPSLCSSGICASRLLFLLDKDKRSYEDGHTKQGSMWHVFRWRDRFFTSPELPLILPG